MLILTRYHSFSLLLVLESLPLDPVCFVFPSDPSLLIHAIQLGTALGISDGSYMPHRYPGLASAAWLLADPLAQKSLLFYGVTPVSGSTLQVNAYQAELYGLYSLLLALERFCSLYHITVGGVLIGCDNKGAIQQAQAFHEYVPCNTHHADLL